MVEMCSRVIGASKGFHIELQVCNILKVCLNVSINRIEGSKGFLMFLRGFRGLKLKHGSTGTAEKVLHGLEEFLGEPQWFSMRRFTVLGVF